MKKISSAIIGCCAVFDAEGILNVYSNSQVVTMAFSPAAVSFMVYKIDKGYVYITTGGVTASRVERKFVKVI